MINFLSALPGQIQVLLIATVPFIELKASIPWGISLGLPIYQIIFFSVMGTLVPPVIFLLIIEPLTKFARKHSPKLDKFFTKLFQKTRENHSKKFDKYGVFFITLFVAVPIPGSGSVTGSLIAFIFGVRFWKAISLIALGTLIASILVLLSVLGIISAIN